MPINVLKDNVMLLKESVKARVYNSLLKESSAKNTAHALIKHLGLKSMHNLIINKPGTIVIVTDTMVIRLPLDKSNTARCRVNKLMLTKLSKTGIAPFVPRFLKEGEFKGNDYYCETKLPGVGIDVPISRMDEMVHKAADFITKFHQETVQDILIDEACFERLFGKEFKELSQYLGDEYKIKLKSIEETLKGQLLGKQFKTVWMHGDYKIENILFDTKTWQIKGIIDWDLSKEEGLPLLDIFYLLLYKHYTLTKRTVVSIFKDKIVKPDFNVQEKEIIDEYLHSMNISDEFIMPTLITFWINHIAGRYRWQLVENEEQQGKWIDENVHTIIDELLSRI